MEGDAVGGGVSSLEGSVIHCIYGEMTLMLMALHEMVGRGAIGQLILLHDEIW
jgi:hypothetical protein